MLPFIYAGGVTEAFLGRNARCGKTGKIQDVFGTFYLASDSAKKVNDGVVDFLE